MDEEMQHELEATVAARRELGPKHDEELIQGFLERVEQQIDRRVDERLAKAGPHRFNSPINPATLGVCIPIIAIAGGIGHLPGLITAFIALVVIFVYADLTRHRR